MSQVFECRDTAYNYIEATFGEEPFVAIHIRPYPDTCLKVRYEVDRLTINGGGYRVGHNPY